MNNSNFKQRFTGIIAALLLTALLPGVAVAQEKMDIRGVIRDANTQTPMSGTLVQIKGTLAGGVADSKGIFSIKAALGEILVFSSLGYLPQEVALTNQTNIEVEMREDVADIERVVVIGYSKTTKKEITGSVASLKEGEFNPGSYSNAAGLLQGKVAGLMITNPNGGDPNASFNILLRGNNTFKAGQEPLFIIDGVVGDDIRNINTQDVESVDVLKDGSAAAIYGTRGTNGVIIITTKRARAGTTQVEYDGQVNIQRVARRAMPMTAKEYKWSIENYYPASTNSIGTADTDWFKEITRTPISHKHSLTVSGGSNTFSHRTMLNVEQNQGLQRKNNSDKYLFRTNINQNLFKGWVELDYNAHFSKRKYSPANYDAFRQAFLHNPTEPVYDDSDPETGGYSRTPGMDYHNPVAMVNEQNIDNVADNFGLSVRATLNILPVNGLKWDNFVSYKQERFEERRYRTFYYPSIIGQKGKAEIGNSFNNSLQWESTLNYSKSFGKHSLQALLGYTYEEVMSQGSRIENFGFENDLLQTNNIGAGSAFKDGNAYINSSKTSNRYIALFGRVMYNYNEKYLASVSLRRDGSTRFGVNSKWGWFPAVSAGWRINREGFMKDVRWIDELKLRAGYGVTGNQDFDNHRSLVIMEPNGYYYHNGEWLSAYGPRSNPNPNLRWEKKSEWNVGLDFTLFGGRLNGTIDYYSRLTSDLVYDYSVSVPPNMFDTLYANVGAVKNSGIEVTLSGSPVKTKNFHWQSTITMSHNVNKIVKFSDDEFRGTSYDIGWLNTPMGVYSQQLIEGQSVGTFYAPVWLGVDESGNDKLKGSIAGEVPREAWEKIGSAYPDAVIGWNNTFTYKNWDLSMQLRASIGGVAFNSYRAEYENINFIGLRNIIGSWLDDTSFTGQPKYSSKYIESTSYLKLDNLSLGYNLNFKSSFIQRMRFSVTAQNLLCITGYSGVDPEVNMMYLSPGIETMSYYPRTTVITFGVNLLF